MNQQIKVAKEALARATAQEALRLAMVGPTSSGAARQLAPVILEAIIAGRVPGVKFVAT